MALKVPRVPDHARKIHLGWTAQASRAGEAKVISNQNRSAGQAREIEALERQVAQCAMLQCTGMLARA